MTPVWRCALLGCAGRLLRLSERSRRIELTIYRPAPNGYGETSNIINVRAHMMTRPVWKGKLVDRALYTIGYEGASLDDFWASLQAVGVRTVLDIRDVPFSRKPGFSKKALGAEAERRGVRYVHLQGLGDPKEGREAARAGLHAQFLSIFSAHMERPEAVADLAEAVELSRQGVACLRGATPCGAASLVRLLPNTAI